MPFPRAFGKSECKLFKPEFERASLILFSTQLMNKKKKKKKKKKTSAGRKRKRYVKVAYIKERIKITFFSGSKKKHKVLEIKEIEIKDKGKKKKKKWVYERKRPNTYRSHFILAFAVQSHDTATNKTKMSIASKSHNRMRSKRRVWRANGGPKIRTDQPRKGNRKLLTHRSTLIGQSVGTLPLAVVHFDWSIILQRLARLFTLAFWLVLVTSRRAFCSLIRFVLALAKQNRILKGNGRRKQRKIWEDGVVEKKEEKADYVFYVKEVRS